MSVPAQTIAAVATAQGRGGVGIVRISGPLASKAAQAFSARELKPRYAHYGPFYGENREVLDEGIAELESVVASYRSGFGDDAPNPGDYYTGRYTKGNFKRGVE